MADELVAAFEPVTDAAAGALLDARYGIPNAVVSRLDTERDDTFHVSSDAGEFVFKIANPADDALVVNLQTAAMAFAAEIDERLPLQRVLPSLDGDVEATLETDAGERIMRVLTWLPGELLRDSDPGDEQLEALGATQARLTVALEDFRHPAATRELVWDVERLPALRPLLAFAPDVASVLDRFDGLVDRLAELPHQVVHNDLNPDNVVVDAASADFVSGILDFGDVVHTARAIDLAVTLSYLLDPDEGWASVLPVISGYERQSRLTASEHELLPDLVAGRLAQRILLGSWTGATKGVDVHAWGLDRSRAQLRSLEL